MRSFGPTLVSCALGLSSFAVGCDSASDKGAEEQALSLDGKADSFARLTEHGDLSFGIDARAEIAAGEVFHAWTFTLGADAKVSVETSVAKNLDTVMYLYRRDAGSNAGWGPFVAKNDDATNKVIYSRITKSLGAGEYRVVVKPFKTALTGKFSVVSSCTGAGCSVAPACVADKLAAFPKETAFTAGCAASLRQLALSPVTSTDRLTVALSQRCKVGAAVRTGVDAYVGYWNETYSWDEFVSDYFEDSEPEMNVDVSVSAAVSVVTLDVGGDEDGLSVVLDKKNKVLMAYQHNQSPVEMFFCAGGASDTKLDAPDESCGSDMLGLPHAAKDATTKTSRGTKAALTSGARADVAFAIKTFYAARGLATSKEVAMNLETWSTGAIITLADAAGSVEYVTAKDSKRIVFQTTGGKTTAPCALP